MKRIFSCILFSITLISVAATAATAQDVDMKSKTEAVWTALQTHCGQAFAGVVTSVPEGDTQLAGVEEIVVHFDSCTDAFIRVPFHVKKDDGSWNRSRTWIFIRNEHGIELRHDHRTEDGAEDATTWYGGFAHKDATASQVEFVPEQRVMADGPNGGWRVIMEPGVRYVYGTIRAGEFRHRLDFNLGKPIETPELPWGYGTLPKGLR